MQTNSLLELLMQALRCLPGVGPKSSQRMAFYLLKEDRNPGLHLASILNQAMHQIKYCCDCRTLTEQVKCTICSNPKRQQSKQLCVVETPADVAAIEQTGQYFGQYFVLMGHLSPLDGIGPKDIGFDLFKQRLNEQQLEEVILATNPTVEGEVTATYLAQICAEYKITATRIAHGVPIGGELDTIDGTTLSHSFIGRQKIEL